MDCSNSQQVYMDFLYFNHEMGMETFNDCHFRSDLKRNVLGAFYYFYGVGEEFHKDLPI